MLNSIDIHFQKEDMESISMYPLYGRIDSTYVVKLGKDVTLFLKDRAMLVELAHKLLGEEVSE